MAETEKRVLLLCFIHGFKGNDDTFKNFPQDLRTTIANTLPHQHVESIVYPKYETKGELDVATSAFLEWLKERVIEIRKTHYEKPWPPDDRKVGVVLVAHSMGGFVASDALFRILDDRNSSENQAGPLFPLIHGILAFDTPYNGLARSMFVYGAFSNYSKVSSVFNVMTALSAAAPATLSKLATRKGLSSAARGATKAATTTRRTSSPAWKAWQLIAVRTGTVGAIAAGGAAAYMHRKQIYEGVQSLRGVRMSDVSDSIAQGYRGSVDALGQGLAYVNRGQVGASFEWMADHFTFVGALLKPAEMARRLERLAALKGVGIQDFYASLGENGVWSGGYFVPERTFCAIPAEQGQPAAGLFSRYVVDDAEDEVQAHMSLFKPEKNKGYERMTTQASNMIVSWFNSDADIFDDIKFAVPLPAEKEENAAVDKAVETVNTKQGDAEESKGPQPDVEENGLAAEVAEVHDDSDGLPDESPLDIAAAASLVPLPDDEADESVKSTDAEVENPEKSKEKQHQVYLRHLFGVAQQAGTNIGSLRSYLPTKLPSIPVEQMTNAMPKVSMPTVSLPNMQMPSVSMFSKKQNSSTEPQSNPEAGSAKDDQDAATVAEVKHDATEVKEG